MASSARRSTPHLVACSTSHGTNHASDAAVQQLAQLTLPEAANNAAENHLGQLVHGLVQDNVPPADGGLGDLISTHVHHWIG